MNEVFYVHCDLAKKLRACILEWLDPNGLDATLPLSALNLKLA